MATTIYFIGCILSILAMILFIIPNRRHLTALDKILLIIYLPFMGLLSYGGLILILWVYLESKNDYYIDEE